MPRRAVELTFVKDSRAAGPINGGSWSMTGPPRSGWPSCQIGNRGDAHENQIKPIRNASRRRRDAHDFARESLFHRCQSPRIRQATGPRSARRQPVLTIDGLPAIFSARRSWQTSSRRAFHSLVAPAKSSKLITSHETGVYRCLGSSPETIA
jgi:hypothetical protein